MCFYIKLLKYVLVSLIAFVPIRSTIKIQPRQLEGVHDTQTTVTVTKGSLREALRQHFQKENNNLYLENSPNYGYSSDNNHMMRIRRHRENDGLLSCRKCGGYSAGRKGRCCASCDRMGYNGCWCKTCDCLCYNY